VPKHISGKEYQNEHNKGQQDIATGTSDTVANTIGAFLGGDKSKERAEAYEKGRQAGKKDITHNEEIQSTPRISGYEGSSGSGSSSGGGGGFDLDSDDAVKTILLVIGAIIGGACWLIYKFFHSMIMGCVNFYRHYKSLDIVRKIEHRKGMVAIAILALVVLPLPTIAIYNNLSHYIYQRYIVDTSTLIIQMNDRWVISCWRNGDENYRGRCVIEKDNLHITLREDKQIAPRIHLSPRQTSHGWYDYQKDTLQIDGVPVTRHEGDDRDVIRQMLRGKTAKMLLIKDTNPVRPYPKEAPNSVVAITKLDNLANVYAKMEETFRKRFKIKPPDSKTWLQ